MTSPSPLSPPDRPPLWRDYLALSKSGIVTLILISVLGGYLAGQPFQENFQPLRLTLTLIGLLLLSSGSSALNQLQEQHIDEKMPRTAQRPLPAGRISRAHALAFVLTTTFGGSAILFQLDPILALLGALAVLSYNGLYTLWWKKHWAFAAIPGAIPGALPIWMGHYAASHDLWAPGGIQLFSLLFFWQMPHFWVLALRYEDDYRKGGIPTLPVVSGPGVTTAQISLWCLAYIAIALGAPLFFKLGVLYLGVAILTSTWVLWELQRFVRAPEGKNWLRFFLSVNFSLILYVGAVVADLWSILLIPHFTR